ncbi:MAG: DUF1656 domain-containing protein [Halieaceae bacterium]|jgi:uncharacterized membrane protein YfcA|nr:DUF1656 domain-containing protein [Halieaceae bacterium]
MPHELAIGDVYLSPLLPVLAASLLGAWICVTILNKLRLSRYIVFPSATFLALMVLFMLLADAYWIRI